MKNLIFLSLVVITLITTSSSCKKEHGCTDPKAIHYDSHADIDDGSCRYYDGAGNIIDENGNIVVPAANNGNNNNGNQSIYTNFLAWSNTNDFPFVIITASNGIGVDSGWINAAFYQNAPACGNVNCYNSSNVIYQATYDVYGENTTLWWEVPNFLMNSPTCNTLFMNVDTTTTGSGLMPALGGTTTLRQYSERSNIVFVIKIHCKATDPVPAKYQQAHNAYIKSVSAKQQTNHN